MEGVAAMQARREGKITLRSGPKRNDRRRVRCKGWAYEEVQST
jgi:hypothetical protein